MSKKITFLTKIIIFILCYYNISLAIDLKILPLKKPSLEEKVIKEKLSKSILKPKEKPTNISTIKTKKTTKTKIEGFLIPQKKPIIKKAKKTKSKIDGILIPKSKPVFVRKEISKTQIKSKYYRKRDFDLAKKAIKEMEKSRWNNALSIAKKARDKSIYDFIQWRHLLARGNKATFYVCLLVAFLSVSFSFGNALYLADCPNPVSSIPFC